DTGTEAPAPRRRRRVPTLWLAAGGAALFGALVGLMVNAAEPGRGGEADPRPPVVDEVGLLRVPGGEELAREEAERVRARHGADAGDRLFFVVLASFEGRELEEARGLLVRLRERGYDVGLANSLVYPELRDGYVAVVAGPYAREQAEVELERLRAEVASDAFLRSVTLRVP
ncbi:MAG TPA: SPOR domain-containing protein, partial [Longimicrobium sp.]|nr:SPOR domain-containing protein [Longimicrobium sp.]